MMTEKTLADQEAEKQTQIEADAQEGQASTTVEVCTNEILIVGSESYFIGLKSVSLPKIFGISSPREVINDNFS